MTPTRHDAESQSATQLVAPPSPGAAVVARVAAERYDLGDPSALRVSVDAMHAALRKRFAAYHIESAARDGRVVDLVAKGYVERERGEAAYRLLAYLDASLADPGRRVVRPVAWVAASHALLMESAGGTSLHDRLAASPDDHVSVRAAVALLRDVHALPAPDFVPRRAARAEASLARIREELRAKLAPAHAERLERLADRLANGGVVDDASPVLLHGDFHPRNVYLEDAADTGGVRITAIDVDHAAVGDPAWDVGYFAGQLLASAHERWGSFERLAPAARVAVDTYVDLLEGDDGAALSARATRFTALTLLESLHYRRCILHSAGAEIDAPYLDVVEHVLEAGPERVRRDGA